MGLKKRHIAIGLLGLLIVFHLVVTVYIHRDIQKSGPALEETAYYFVYGSNMSTRYLSNIRHIVSYESMAATLDNASVKFNLPGLRYLEPSFASLVSAEGERALGVVHRIEKADFSRLISSEFEEYRWIEVTVATKEKGLVKAFTFLEKDGGREMIPSSRYIDIMIEGTEKHGLPKAYIDELSNKKGAYVPALSELVGTLIYAMIVVGTSLN